MSLFSVVCLLLLFGGGGGRRVCVCVFGLKIGALEIAVISIDNSKTGLFKSIIVRALASLFFFFFPRQYQIINDVRSYSLLIVYVVFSFFLCFLCQAHHSGGIYSKTCLHPLQYTFRSLFTSLQFYTAQIRIGQLKLSRNQLLTHLNC